MIVKDSRENSFKSSWVWLAVGVVSIPFVLVGLSLLFGEPKEYEVNPISDLALIEIGVIQASEGTRLLGPFSRFMWNHPGPAMFYALVPFYQLFGRNQIALSLGAMVINLAAVLIILFLSFKLGGWRLYVSSAILLLFTVCLLDANVALVWNPVITILPFGALLYISAAISLGRIVYLPLAVVVASFVVQSHIAYVPTVGALAIASCAILVFRQIRGMRSEKVSGSRRTLVWILLSLILLAVLWSPVLFEEFTSDPGNLSKLVGFFARGDGRSLQEALGLLAGLPVYVLARLSRQSYEAMVDVFAAPFLIIQLILVTGALWAGIRKRLNTIIVLSLVCLTALAGALISTTRIVGSMQWYLLFWMSMISITILATALAALLHAIENRKPDRILRKSPVIMVIVIVTLTVAWAAREFSYVPTPDEARPGAVQYLSEKITEYIQTENLGKPEFRVVTHEFWGESCGVILRLHKNGVPLTINDALIYRFGKKFITKGESVYEIHFYDAEGFRSVEASPVLKLIAEFEGLYACAIDAASLRSRFYSGRFPVNAVGCAGDTQVLTDGYIPRFDIEPNDSTSLMLTGANSSITLVLPEEKIEGLEIHSYAFDRYAVSGSIDGDHFQRLGTMEGSHGRGIQAKLFFSGKLSECSHLRIIPLESGGLNAIAEIRLILLTQRR